MKYLLIFLLLTISCGKKSESSKLDILEKEYNNKLEQLNNINSKHIGMWPSDEDCDAALWAGLASRAGSSSNPKAAVTSEGRTTRKPYSDCLIPTESAASTSNDMFLGIILGLYTIKDLTTLELIFEYSKNNNWIIGYPTSMLGRIYLKPNNRALLARAIHKLGGKYYIEKDIPLSYLPLSEADYPTHLQFISIILARDTGTTGYLAETIVQQTCNNNEQDALAMAVCMRDQEAVELLLGDYQYPTYVRGSSNYQLVHWLLAAKLILE